MVMIHMTAVVAMAENRVIGDGKGLIWHIPDDLKRVKTLTMGCPLIMGRKTWDSIGRPLPGRASIVMTRDADWAADGAIRVATMTAAIAAARDWIEATAEARPEIILFGGGHCCNANGTISRPISITRHHETGTTRQWAANRIPRFAPHN